MAGLARGARRDPRRRGGGVAGRVADARATPGGGNRACAGRLHRPSEPARTGGRLRHRDGSRFGHRRRRARPRAIGLGLDALKRTYGIDASAYEFEFIQRSFPAGTVEMTWRNPTPRFGHVEQLRVNLQGERDRARRAHVPGAARLHGAENIVGWPRAAAGRPGGHRRRVRRRLGVRAVRAVQDAELGCVDQAPAAGDLRARARTGRAHDNRQSGALQSAISIVAMSVLLVGTVLPALSGVTLWIGRQHPARLWAAEQLIRGKVLVRGVSASLVDGVAGGVVIAAAGVLADWVALTLPGFVPSISREIGAVEAGIGSRWSARRSAASSFHRAWHCPGRGSARPGQAPPRGLDAHRRRSAPALVAASNQHGDSAGARAHRRHERRAPRWRCGSIGPAASSRSGPRSSSPGW